MFLKHVVHPGPYLHVSNLLVRFVPLVRLLQQAWTGGSQTCRANEVSVEAKCHPVKMLSDSLEALQSTQRSLVLVTHTHRPFGSVKGAAQDFFHSSFFRDVFVTLVQSCILDSAGGLMFSQVLLTCPLKTRSISQSSKFLMKNSEFVVFQRKTLAFFPT